MSSELKRLYRTIGVALNCELEMLLKVALKHQLGIGLWHRLDIVLERELRPSRGKFLSVKMYKPT